MTNEPGIGSVFVHKLALCESNQVGSGSRIWAFAHVMGGAILGQRCNVCDHVFIETGAQIGDNVTIKNGAFIWEGVTIEDDVFIGPGAVFTNDLRPRAFMKKSTGQLSPTTVRRGASIGAGAVLVCGIEIGQYAMIGAGSVVVKDIPAHALVVGNPAHRLAWVCVCSLRLPPSMICVCGRSYELINEGRGLVETHVSKGKDV